MKALLSFGLIFLFAVTLSAQTWHSKFDFNIQSEDGGAMATVGNVGIGFYSTELDVPVANINQQAQTPYLPQKQLHIIGYEDEENPEFIAPTPTIRLDHRTIDDNGAGNTGGGEQRSGGPAASPYLEYTAQQHVWDLENDEGILGFVKDGTHKVKYSGSEANFGMPVAGAEYDLNVYGTVRIGLNASTAPNDLIVNGPSTLKGILKSQNEAFFENQVLIGDPTTIYNAQSDPNNKLIVQGTGVFQEVVVDHVSEWNDKVFEADYDLLELSKLEVFISINGHLPEVPKEEEVIEKGYDMAKMDALLLKKIEELTLHVIALNKENEMLKTKIK
ncbi:MAG: hypothetical protein RH860_12465 [Cytophagales bacterium]